MRKPCPWDLASPQNTSPPVVSSALCWGVRRVGEPHKLLAASPTWQSRQCLVGRTARPGEGNIAAPTGIAPVLLPSHPVALLLHGVVCSSLTGNGVMGRGWSWGKPMLRCSGRHLLCPSSQACCSEHPWGETRYNSPSCPLLVPQTAPAPPTPSRMVIMRMQTATTPSPG